MYTGFLIYVENYLTGQKIVRLGGWKESMWLLKGSMRNPCGDGTVCLLTVWRGHGTIEMAVCSHTSNTREI